MIHARQDYNERVQDSANLIPDDEPVVLLRGQDALAIEAIRVYANLCRMNQAPDVAAKMEAHLKLMEEWPKKKIPDLPASESEEDCPSKCANCEDVLRECCNCGYRWCFNEGCSQYDGDEWCDQCSSLATDQIKDLEEDMKKTDERATTQGKQVDLPVALQLLSTSFHNIRENRLRQKQAAGYRGWDDPHMIPKLESALIDGVQCLCDHDDHVQDIDIANLAMMIGAMKRVEDPEYGNKE